MVTNSENQLRPYPITCLASTRFLLIALPFFAIMDYYFQWRYCFAIKTESFVIIREKSRRTATPRLFATLIDLKATCIRFNGFYMCADFVLNRRHVYLYKGYYNKFCTFCQPFFLPALILHVASIVSPEV